MAVTTYITSTEAGYFYPNHTNFSESLRSNALTTSKGLVDSFINSKFKLPVIGEWDGESAIEAPYILKVLQSKFYRYLLESGNVGDTDDLRNLWETTVETLRNLRDGEVDIPSLVYDNEPGWHVSNVTRTSSLGGVQVRGASALTYRKFYRVVVTSTGTQYVAAMTYTVYRSDSATAILTNQAASIEWVAIDSSFDIRFDGQWTLNDEIRIVGIPQSDVNTSGTPSNSIKQGLVLP